MRQLRQMATVAGWEFRRFFKWKDQVISLVFFLVIGVVWAGVGMIAAAKGRTMTVALSGVELTAPADGRLRFVPATGDDVSRLEALKEGDLHGVLTRHPDGRFELLVAKDPRYRGELETLLNDAVRRERLAASGVSAEWLERILEPPPFEVSFTNPHVARRGTAEKIAAAIFVGIMLTAVFTSMAYIMTGIAGEKQLRVTESVISAISPQAWVDGKVLGLTGYALVSVVNMIVGGLIVAAAAALTTGFTLPEAAIRPGVVVALLVYALLGVLLWSSFFAAVASTLDDPNTSSRTPLMMLPALPVVMSLAVLRDPDGMIARTLALVPLTSAPALPMRLVLSDPGAVEIAVSLVLLVAAIWLMRRIAGKIFEVGMLLYGKEPSLREVLRWAR